MQFENKEAAKTAPWCWPTEIKAVDRAKLTDLVEGFQH